MKSLLSDEVDVRPFARTKRAVVSVEHPLEIECARLRAELADASVALTRAKAEATKAVDDAREEGHATGLTKAQDQEAARRTALMTSLEAASEAFRERLDELDGLAAQIAHAALSRLLDAPEKPAQLTASFIARQFSDLQAAGIVKLCVSGSDFADNGALVSLADRMNLDRAQIEIAIDNGLSAGEARFECRLGQVDLNRNTQWSALERLLASVNVES